VLSHNGMDVDLKMASRVTGIDAIFGGHTHDGVPQPVKVKNAKGMTLVTNAGSNGKFLGVMDFDVRGGKVQSFKYRLLPVFSNLLPADPAMDAYIKKMRAPYEDKLNEKLAVTDDFLYRRGNFNGTWDQLLVDALMEVKGADAAFSPGFRWGTTLLPGDAITMERLMDQTAITYPQTTLTEMSGETIKTIMEDVADNLFNADPYYQQGGDMVRVGGIEYTIDPTKKIGRRIGNMTLNGKPVNADKTYMVAGWAPSVKACRVTGGMSFGAFARQEVIKGLNEPGSLRWQINPGIADYDGGHPDPTFSKHYWGASPLFFILEKAWMAGMVPHPGTERWPSPHSRRPERAGRRANWPRRRLRRKMSSVDLHQGIWAGGCLT
jgi:sulfur-oxidizing protein SoxB